MKDVALTKAVPSLDALRWLCLISLAAARCAHAIVSLLGSLRQVDAERYIKVMRLPAIQSCAKCEVTLDAVLRFLCDQDPLAKPGPKDLVLALNASGAQVATLYRSAFGEEAFLS